MKNRLALACALLTFSASYASAQDRAILRAAEPVPNSYIVVLADSHDALSVGLQSQTVHRGRLARVYNHAINGFAMQLTPAAAAALARDPRVRYVEEDSIVRALETQTAAPWNLDRTDQRSLPLNGLFNYPPIGPAVYVHILDTGIRATHVDFTGRASIAGDFVDDDKDGDPNDVGNDDGNPGEPDGADCHGHGTHVAGTIGGATWGIAKNATLLAYRVLDCSGSGTLSAVVAALDRVTADTRRPAVANMSLGGSPSFTLDEAVRRSIAAGVTYAVSAGNDAIDASLGSPSRVAEAITVAATNSSDTRASFSNFGAVVDLFAPGVSVRSAYHTSDTATAQMSGTSMSSPLVAGVAALYLQAVGNRTPAQVRDALVNNATQGVVSDTAGAPNRLAYSGFMLGEPPPPPPPPPPSWTFTATPATIEPGQSSVLAFTTTTADVHVIKINGLLRPAYSCDAVSCAGSITVTPTMTTTYTLTSVNSAGTPYPSLAATVTVAAAPLPPPPPPPPPPVWTFTATPATVLPGQSSVLSFTTTTADVHVIKINGLLRPAYSCDAVSCAGSITVTPTVTTTYTLTSVNSSGTPYPQLTTTVTLSAP